MKRIAILAALGLFLPTLIFAQSCEWICSDPDTNPIVPGSYNDKIIISELLPNPEGDDGDGEFIELESISNKIVELQGWWLEDESGRKYIFSTEEIKSGKFFVVERSLSRISLNNTGGDEVTLFSPDEEIQSTVTYEGTAKEGWSYAFNETWNWTMTPSPGKQNIIEIPNDSPLLDVEIPKEIHTNGEVTFSAENSSDPDDDSITVLWQFSDDVRIEGITATRSFESSGEYEVKVTVEDDHKHKTFDHFSFYVSAFDLAVGVFINELYPKPVEGEQEFVEITNTEGRVVELAGWKLTDGARTYTFPNETIIKDGEFFLIEKDVSGIALNDSGDTLTLLRPDESEADTTSYLSAKRGESYSRYDLEWNWVTPTPAQENVVQEEDGVVLGATVSASGVIPEIKSKISFTESFVDMYAIYLLSTACVGIVGFGLYKKWKKDKMRDEEFEIE